MSTKFEVPKHPMCRIRSYYFLSELMDLVYHRLSIIKQQRKANRRLLLRLSVEESCCCCISTCHGGDSNKQMPVRLSHSKMLHRVAAKFLNGPLICQLSPWVQNDSLTQPVPWSSLIRFLFFPLHRPCSRRHHSIYIVTTLSSFFEIFLLFGIVSCRRSPYSALEISLFCPPWNFDRTRDLEIQPAVAFVHSCSKLFNCFDIICSIN